MKKNDWQFLVDVLMFTCILVVVLIGIIMGLLLGQGPSGHGTAKYFLGLHRHQWGDMHLLFSVAFCGLLVLHLALDWNWIKGRARQVFKSAWIAGLAMIVILPFGVLAMGWSLSAKNDQYYASFGQRSEARNKTRHKKMHSRDTEPVLVDDSSDDSCSIHHGCTEDGNSGDSGNNEKEGPSPESTEPLASDAHATHHSHESSRMVGGRGAKGHSKVTITGRATLLEVESESGIAAVDVKNCLELPPTAPMDMPLGHLRRIYGFSMRDVRDCVEQRLSDP